jgi:hypothetical protein
MLIIYLHHALVAQLLQGPYGPYIQSFKDKAQLLCPDLHYFITIVRPFEPVLLKPFLPKAKPVPVPVQDLEDRLASITKHKKMAGKRIETQGAFREDREAVYCLSHVRASRRKKDPHMRRQENHIRPNTRTTRSRSSESNPLPISMR